MKVFIACGEAAAFMKIKVTVPRKWLEGPASKLLEFGVGTYNNKFPSNALDEACQAMEVSRETNPDDKIFVSTESIMGKVIQGRDTVYIRPRSQPRQKSRIGPTAGGGSTPTSRYSSIDSWNKQNPNAPTQVIFIASLSLN